MKKYLIALLCCITFMLSCENKSPIMKSIERIDSLQTYTSLDSAYNEIMKIDTNELKTADEKMYYSLVKTEIFIDKGLNLPDKSIIDSCIKYYEKRKDYDKLFPAYYYKGFILFSEDGNTMESILYMKKAETVEKYTINPTLRYMLYLNMAYLNVVEGTNKVGLEYARKALAETETKDGENKKCLALNNIALCFYYMGCKDSAEVYIEKTKQYVNRITRDEDRAIVLSNIGVLYYDNGMYGKADPLFRQALALLPVPTTQINLAKNSYFLGNTHETDSLLKLAWPNTSMAERAEILQFQAERAEKEGKFEEAAKLYKQAKAVQDSVNNGIKTEETTAMQRDYDRNEHEQEVNQKNIIAGAAAAVVIILLAAGVTYHRKKINRAKSAIENGNRIIEEYSEKIAQLEQSDSMHTNEAQQLRRKIKKLKDEQAAILGRGQQLYEDITAGGTTATWKKKDFDEFIEFYRIGHPQAVADAENNYKSLSSTNIFYLTLMDMGVNDADAQRTMGMTAGAMRTMKSRINSRKKA